MRRMAGMGVCERNVITDRVYRIAITAPLNARASRANIPRRLLFARSRSVRGAANATLFSHIAHRINQTLAHSRAPLVGVNARRRGAPRHLWRILARHLLRGIAHQRRAFRHGVARALVAARINF